ncbi:DUF998 domain-containing protein [Jeotgalibaca sp. A122]|uniref:DUF998 domain-containing protein n=1 Tax=Jeotgalibaca sp. A122 TaxID=3457322 RepID=UPI003FCEFF05
MKRKLIHRLGLLGPISLISYIVAVLFSPNAYPGYDGMSQAVSDLSAQDAPSRMLWQQLASVYNTAGVVAITLVCVYVENRLTKTLRIGIYLFGIMNWISAVGYAMFPLSTSGHAETLQDAIHIYVVTALIVLFSILSLVTIIIGGFQDRAYQKLAIWAFAALVFMFLGAIGTGVVPEAYSGIPERFSVFAATAFNAVLGIYLFNGFGGLNN